MERADWSDAFFDYVPAACANAEYYTSPGRADKDEFMRLMLPEAQAFREANPGCPMTAYELVVDYMGRI